MRARLAAGFLVAVVFGAAATAQTLSNPPGANPSPAPPPASVVPPPQDPDTACMPQPPSGAASRLHVEVRGDDGLYAGSETVLVSDMSGQPVVSITCGGPYANFRLTPGRYRIRAFIGARQTNEVALDVPAGGARAVLQFAPEPSRDDEVL